MLSLIKRIWQNGETVDADKMNTISTDLDTLNTGKIDEPETAGTENQVLSIDSLGRRIWRTVTGGSSVWGQITGTLSNQTDLQGVISGLNADIAQKQATLVSGTNIKTINNNSLLGSGNIDIQGGGGTWGSITGTLSDQTDITKAISPLINQWDEQWEVGYLNASGIVDKNYTNRFSSKNFIPVIGGEQYFVKVPYAVTTYSIRIAWYDANKAFISVHDVYSTTITAPSTAKYLKFTPHFEYGTPYNNDISINYPSNCTGYYPSVLPKTEMHIGGLGNAVASRGFNQLVQNGNFASTDGWYSEGTLTVSGNVAQVVTPYKWGGMCCRAIGTLVSGHKYLLKVKIKTSGLTCAIGLGINQTTYASGKRISTNSTNWYEGSLIFTSNGTETNIVSNQDAGDSGTTYWLKDINLFDLTAIFGAGNEPLTITDFRAMFPADYYQYSGISSGSFGDLLWTNASPTSEFAAQIINLDLSAYSAIYVIFRIVPTTNDSSFVFAKITGYYYYCLNFLNDGINRYRPFYATNSGVRFVTGRKNTAYASDCVVDNTLMVPWYIYGIK